MITILCQICPIIIFKIGNWYVRTGPDLQLPNQQYVQQGQALQPSRYHRSQGYYTCSGAFVGWEESAVSGQQLSVFTQTSLIAEYGECFFIQSAWRKA